MKISASLTSRLFHSKYGKLVPILLLSAMVITATAAVFELFFVNTTATVRSNDISLVAGSDASGSCTVYPCATVSISGTNDYATVSLSFAKSAANNPQPSTYYTDLVEVHDAANSHTVSSVSVISPITATSGSDFGKITVYYCTSQTNDPATNCPNKVDITSTSGTGTVFTGTDTLSSGNTRYIEIIAYAGSGATNGDAVSFNIQVQWA
jgi:hypothetical protein